MHSLCVISGDGIGLEVIPAAMQVLQAAIPDLEIVPAEAGWECFLRHGVSVPQETLDILRCTRAGLFGAVSSPSYPVSGYRSAILTMRQELGLYANLRPIRSLPGVSPQAGIDMLVVRENTEGLYSERERSDGETAIAERVITRAASARIGRTAARLALASGYSRLTIVHKANVLPQTDGLFRDSVRKAVAESTGESGTLSVDELLVDTAAYRLASDPGSFQMIVTTNLFGDILSDIGAHWCGGIGLAPSLNLGDGIALAEPVHGSAPDIAGKGIANPIAAILSAALLVRYQWGLEAEASRIEQAIRRHLVKFGRQTLSTQDILASVLAWLE
jgi:homoisocitrate dehydrogenase